MMRENQPVTSRGYSIIQITQIINPRITSRTILHRGCIRRDPNHGDEIRVLNITCRTLRKYHISHKFKFSPEALRKIVHSRDEILALELSNALFELNIL